MPAVTVTSTEPFTAWLVSTDVPDFAAILQGDQTALAKASVLDMFSMMAAIAEGGYRTQTLCYCPINHSDTGITYDPPVYELLITRAGYPDQSAVPGQWVVFDGKIATVIDDADYQKDYIVQTTSSPTPAT